MCLNGWVPSPGRRTTWRRARGGCGLRTVGAWVGVGDEQVGGAARCVFGLGGYSSWGCGEGRMGRNVGLGPLGTAVEGRHLLRKGMRWHCAHPTTSLPCCSDVAHRHTHRHPALHPHTMGRVVVRRALPNRISFPPTHAPTYHSPRMRPPTLRLVVLHALLPCQLLNQVPTHPTPTHPGARCCACRTPPPAAGSGSSAPCRAARSPTCQWSSGPAQRSAAQHIAAGRGTVGVRASTHARRCARDEADCGRGGPFSFELQPELQSLLRCSTGCATRGMVKASPAPVSPLTHPACPAHLP